MSNERPIEWQLTNWGIGDIITSHGLNKIEDQVENLTTQVNEIDKKLIPFTGPDNGNAGIKGVVPAPQVGDENKYLKGDGSWETPAVRHGSKEGSVIEGSGSIAGSSSSYAHAEGSGTIAGNYAAHAEGNSSQAIGDTSHAEGNGTQASGRYSHVEGDGSQATADDAHAEGLMTVASGAASHAEGVYTIANHQAQHVFGEYNIGDPSTAEAIEKGAYIEIVGNGTSSVRSNARTLDWEGNEVVAGNITATSFIGSGANLTNIPGTVVGLATSSVAGAMSSADFTKLYNLPTNDNLAATYVAKSSVADASGIPNADTTQYGLVKVGSNINVDNGTISVPLATSSISGVVSVGNGLSINNGVISNNLNIKNGAGNYSIIAGDSNNVASADYSYAIGRKTVAQKECQYVFGKYNKIDTSTDGTFVEIVGNGELGARSNARTLDWDGNEWVAGQMTATQFNGSGAGLTSIPPNIIIPLKIEIDPDDNNWTTQSASQGGNISTHYLHDLTISGITSTSIIFIIPNAIDSYICTTCEASYVLQKDNQITFCCRTKPSRKITIGVIVYN